MLKELPGCLGIRIIRSCSKTDRGVVRVFGDGQGDGCLVLWWTDGETHGHASRKILGQLKLIDFRLLWAVLKPSWIWLYIVDRARAELVVLGPSHVWANGPCCARAACQIPRLSMTLTVAGPWLCPGRAGPLIVPGRAGPWLAGLIDTPNCDWHP